MISLWSPQIRMAHPVSFQALYLLAPPRKATRTGPPSPPPSVATPISSAYALETLTPTSQAAYFVPSIVSPRSAQPQLRPARNASQAPGHQELISCSLSKYTSYTPRMLTLILSFFNFSFVPPPCFLCPREKREKAIDQVTTRE